MTRYPSQRTEAELHGELERILSELARVVVALSGGTDSGLLACMAARVLGPSNVAAVTVESPFQPAHETKRAAGVCEHAGIRHIIIRCDPLEDDDIAANPPLRCYLCKRKIFSTLLRTCDSLENGPWVLVDGTCADDSRGHRPGLKALTELGVRSPLLEAGVGKRQIFAMAREMLPEDFVRPSSACLATRIPYGERITRERLARVEAAEEKLHELGVISCRVRDHIVSGAPMARIEIPQEHFASALEAGVEITSALERCGYEYVVLDLKGYRPSVPPSAPCPGDDESGRSIG